MDLGLHALHRPNNIMYATIAITVTINFKGSIWILKRDFHFNT